MLKGNLITGLESLTVSIQTDFTENNKQLSKQLKDDIVKTSKAIVPVDTERLKNSIDGEVKIGKDGGVVIEIIADTDYALAVEFGTYKMRPQPYITPSIVSNMISYGLSINKV
jgi:HK97 gp10 family phage protein